MLKNVKSRLCILLTFVILFAIILSACGEARIGLNDESKNSITGKTNIEESSGNNESSEQSHDAIKANYTPDGLDEAATKFAIDMLELCTKDGENSMISPISILTALGMTANGAKGDTLKEMESVMFGGKSIDEFNKYYNNLIERITKPTKGSLSLANSIWYNTEPDRLTMNQNFIDFCKDIFQSEVSGVDFRENENVKLINSWVSDKTDGNIKDILKEFDPAAVIFLINAIYFEAKWKEQYTKESVYNTTFHSDSGDVITSFMRAGENYYIKDDNAIGFSKPYEGNEFSFVALMPDEGTTVNEYLSQLTEKKLLNLIKNRQQKSGLVSLPKFKTEFDASLVEPLKQLGMKSAFDNADFKDMATSIRGNIFIGDVKHKTFIEVNEAGTKAAAVTLVQMNDKCAPEYTFDITFDRPFIYMIVDEKTSLPLFIGIINNPTK